jgi:hypothetical protein
MFCGSRQPRLNRSSGRDSDRSDRAADETVRRAAHETWRGSAQRVTRAWNAWLAADRPERGGRYRADEEALAEEERAAARVERMLQFAASDSKRSQTTAEGEAPQGPASAGGSGAGS